MQEVNFLLESKTKLYVVDDESAGGPEDASKGLDCNFGLIGQIDDGGESYGHVGIGWDGGYEVVSGFEKKTISWVYLFGAVVDTVWVVWNGLRTCDGMLELM